MLKTRFFLICIFLCGILSTGSITAADYYTNALRIFSEQKYYVASIEFERAIFHETDNNKIALCKYYKSLCYKQLGDNIKALDELNGINLFNLPDSLSFSIRYELALCNYLNNDPNQSLWNIEEIKSRFPDSIKNMDIIPLNILCMNDLRKFDEAIDLWDYFLKNSELDDSVRASFKAEINNLYKKGNIPRYHSPKRAENLSRFIPGSGQMYCGEMLEGTLNLLINASLLSFAFYEFYYEYYITGYFVGLGVFNKTYHGGMHRAHLLAEENNRKSLNKFNLKSGLLLTRIFDHSRQEKTK